MGFGFNLFLGPFLLLVSVGIIIYAAGKQSWKALWLLAGPFGVVALIFLIRIIVGPYHALIRLTEDDIIGEYRIDTAFYPGVHAQWQYQHYRFFIDEEDSLALIVYPDSAPPRSYKYKIEYSDGPPDHWRISSGTPHHVVEHRPILYRSKRKFYYVLYSEVYGNMFFRKQPEKE